MRVLFTFSMLFFSNFLIGQTVVCNPGMGGVEATDEFPGCRMCVNLYQGNNGSYTADANPNTACGSVENSLWLSFIADDSGEFEATFLSSNCTNGQGLELSLFDVDLNNIGCFDGNGPGNITASGLLPGEVHYVMIDGNNGAACDFTFIINSGGTNFGAPARVDEIVADQEGNLCVGAEVCYSIEPVANASSYIWGIPTIATVIDGGGLTDEFVCVRMNAPGGNVISVIPNNECFNGTITIKQFVTLASIDGPDISCSNSSDGIDFVWDALPDADSYQVFINGALVADVTDPSYSVSNLMPGAFVNIRVVGQGECTYTPSVLTCTFTVSSVEQNFVNSQMQIVPNPTAGNIRIETDLRVEEITVYSTTGQLLVKENNTIFDLKRFGAGIYFLKIRTEEGVGVKRVLVN